MTLMYLVLAIAFIISMDMCEYYDHKEGRN